jgi:hypothetical protein
VNFKFSNFFYFFGSELHVRLHPVRKSSAAMYTPTELFSDGAIFQMERLANTHNCRILGSSTPKEHERQFEGECGTYSLTWKWAESVTSNVYYGMLCILLYHVLRAHPRVTVTLCVRHCMSERRSEAFVEIGYLHCCVLFCVFAVCFVFEFKSSQLAI